jgi:hypothetical protein
MGYDFTPPHMRSLYRRIIADVSFNNNKNGQDMTVNELRLDFIIFKDCDGFKSV